MIEADTLAAQPRIVSLISSATEILCALGMGSCIVGRSHECDFPPSITALPVVTEARVDAALSSAEIHQQVTQASRLADEGDPAAGALSIYRIDTALLRALAPDLIVTQSQCRVCAVSLEDVERALGGIVGSRPRIVSLEPHDLPDVWRDIERVGQALNIAPRAAQLVAQLNDRLDQVRLAVKDRPTPSVVCLEWIEPLMVAGNWAPRLVRIAGGRDRLGPAGAHAPWLEWDQFHEADPDVIVLMPCGFGLEKTIEESGRLLKHPGFRNYRAVRGGRVFAVDGNSFFNRPGPRLVESAQILAEVLHGPAAHYGHEGTAWKRLRMV